MKSLSFKKVRNSLFAALLAGGAMMSAMPATAIPTLVMPSNPDNIWYTLPGLTWALNSSVIATGGGAMYCSMATSGAGGGWGRMNIAVNDYPSGLTTSWATPPLTQTGANDIILGNTDGTWGGTNPYVDYVMAICFTNAAGDPEVDFFRVNDAGGPVILPISTFVISPGTYHPGNIHMDVIADYSNFGLTGYAFCGRFMITWDDSYSGNVFVAEGDLNTQTVGAAQTVGAGYSPDVAGIIRGTYPFINDFALITYNGAGGSVMYSEWKVGSVPLVPWTLDPGLPYGCGAPRIDGYDDYNVNSGPGAQWKVVTRVYNGTNYEVRTYDNTGLWGFPVSNYDDLTPGGFPPPPYHCMAPSVQVLYTQDFAVLHVDEAIPSYWHHGQVLVMEPTDNTNPTTLWGNDYFWVNGAGAMYYNAAGADFYNSVAAGPNDNSWNIPELFTWAVYNGTNWEIRYKTILGFPSFKPGTTNSVSNVALSDLKVYPNPATNVLNLNIPSGQAVSDYHILDVTGRVAASGSLAGGTQSIDISKLNSGTYILKLWNGSNELATRQFVKVNN